MSTLHEIDDTTRGPFSVSSALTQLIDICDTSENRGRIRTRLKNVLYNENVRTVAQFKAWQARKSSIRNCGVKTREIVERMAVHLMIRSPFSDMDAETADRQLIALQRLYLQMGSTAQRGFREWLATTDVSDTERPSSAT